MRRSRSSARKASGLSGVAERPVVAMSLPTLQKVEKLQRALHAKAKESPEFRFYNLYEKL